MEMLELRALVSSVVTDPTLTYAQRVHRLAGLAENALVAPPVSEACRAALDKRVICDMYEGAAPYRPRYVLPDYARLLAAGSAFLELPAARDLDEALTTLLVAYTQVPSITGYPVYVGDLDVLLEPFVSGLSDAELDRRLRLFWVSLDRILPDAFTHADLGPDDGRVVRAILRLERELLQVVPNLTLRVDPERTPGSLVLDAVETVFACGKPHFVNHPMMVADLGERYAAVSCYNSLPIGGGAHTLVRLNLREVVLAHSGSIEELFATTIPHYVELTAELMESRIRFLVEQARFYEHSWLVDEGLVSPDRFSAMFGVFGLAEAVDLLMERDGSEQTYGHGADADAVSYRITRRVAEIVAARPQPYCEGNGGRAFLHSQSGIDLDEGTTAGTRIPVGSEPPLPDHLATVAPHHRLFTAGVSDVLAFDDTARANPEAVVDVIRGAFLSGMRDVTFNLDSNDFVRITGYLVRKSDLARTEHGARHASTFLGAGAMQTAHLADRRPKRVISRESAPRAGG